MWISKKVSLSNSRNYQGLEGEVTYSSLGTVNVQNSSEHRDVSTVSPRGISYVPIDGDKTVIIPVGDSYICPGVILEDKNLLPGELMLYSSGGASITLKNDGNVLINGKQV